MRPRPREPMFSVPIESTLNLIFPPTCLGCGERFHAATHHDFLCQACERKIRTIAGDICARCGAPTFEGPVSTCRRCPKFDSFYCLTRSAATYESPMRELIHEFKFNASRRVRPFLFERFVEGADRHFDRKDFDAIVPVPLHWWRKFQREFNQAELLGQQLSEAWDVPILPRAIKRTRMTVPQSRLPGRWREINIQGAFGSGDQSVAGCRVLLVDDVMTTGRTLAACSSALISGGAESVVGYTLARRL